MANIHNSYVPTVLFDLDETLADYDKAVRKFAKRLVPKGADELELHGDPLPAHINALRFVMWQHPGFWANMEPLETGEKLLKWFEEYGYKVVFVTRARLEANNAWSEKAAWVRNYYPGKTLLVTSGDKSLVFGDVIVDDNLRQVELWLNHWKDGLAIIPVNGRNAGFEHDRAVYYTDSSMAEEMVKEVHRNVVPF